MGTIRSGSPAEEVRGKHTTLFKARKGNATDARDFAVQDGNQPRKVNYRDVTKKVIKEFIPPVFLRLLKRN